MSSLVFNAGVIGDWFKNLWISLWLMIDNVIYIFINWMYRVFILVAKVDIFGGGDQIKAITQRLYLIVGIAMLFIFAYNLVLLIVNPEGNQLKNMGKVVQNALISIILVTLLPTIFSYLSTIQANIIDSNVIGHIILGTSGTDIDTTNKKAGVDTALTVFSAFYHPKGETKYSCENGGTHPLCSKYVSVYEDAYNNDDISSFIWDDDLKQGVIDDEMEYNYFISSIAGGIALWIFISFSLDIGVRVAKLAFYEIISPIPVMMRILPNDKMFKKWFDGITKTFISLFVRLAVIFFCMYAITLVPDILTGMWASSGDNVILLALANVLVILGILMFAKEAPKLIGDLFGGGGGLDFSIGKKYKEAAKPLGRVADMGRSGIYSKLYGGANGEGGSFFAGAWRGRHGYKQGVEATDTYSEAISNGSTFSGRMQDRFRNAVGMKSRYDAAGADAEKVMKKEKIEDRRNQNNKASELIKNAKDTSGNIVQAKDSNYKSQSNAYEDFVDRGYRSYAKDFEDVTDANGKTYSLNGKNYNEMLQVYDKAIRDGASNTTLSALRKSVTQAKQFADVIDTNGNNYNLNGKNYDEMKAVLDQAVSDGASAQTINTLKEAMTDFKNSAKASGKTYNLNDKNHYEMKAVLDEAIRNNASSETITQLEREIEKFEKQSKDNAIKDALKGDMSNIQDRYKNTLQNTITDLQTKVAEGVAQTFNSAGELVAGVTEITNLDQFKDAEKIIKDSNRELDKREESIKKHDKTFKAKKADRDYINNQKKGGGK